MFADVDADIYVLVDGDATYDAASAPAMIERLRGETLDVVSGRRVAVEQEAYRFGHGQSLDQRYRRGEFRAQLRGSVVRVPRFLAPLR